MIFRTATKLSAPAQSQCDLFRRNKSLLLIIALWFLFITSSGSKTIAPSITPFLITIVLLAALWMGFRKYISHYSFGLPEVYASALLMFGLLVLIYGFVYSDLISGSVYLVKFISLSVLFLFFFCLRLPSDCFFKVLWFVLLSNLLVLAFAIATKSFEVAGSPFLFQAGSGRRIYTVLNVAGMLWKTGFMVLPGLVYLYLRSSQIRWLFMSMAAAAIIGLDGSRTGTIFVFLFLLVFLPFYWRHRQWQFSTLLRASVLGLVVIGGLMFVRPIVDIYLSEEPAIASLDRIYERSFERFAGLIDVAEEQGSSLNTTDQVKRGVEQSEITPITGNDKVRMAMITSGFEQVRRSPLFGSGIGATSVMTTAGPMVVHMTYLQVWGDYGLFGALLFTTLMSFPIWVIGRRASFMRLHNLSLTEGAGLVCAVVIVVSYPLYGLLHPLSNEFSEWAPYLLAFGVILNTLPKRSGNIQHGSQNNL